MPIAEKKPHPAWTFLRKLFESILILAMCAGAFVLGRASQAPPFQSLLPKLDPPSVHDAPEKIIQRVFSAAADRNVEQVVSFFHPAAISHYWENYNAQVKALAGIFAPYTQVSVLQAEDEAAVALLVAVTEAHGGKQSYTFRFKRYQGQWKIVTAELTSAQAVPTETQAASRPPRTHY